MVEIGDVQVIGRLDPKNDALSWEELMDKCSPNPQKPLVVLTHRPEEFRAISASGADLALAGHTHGFNIPQFLGSNLLEDMYYGRKKYGEMTAITRTTAKSHQMKKVKNTSQKVKTTPKSYSL